MNVNKDSSSSEHSTHPSVNRQASRRLVEELQASLPEREKDLTEWKAKYENCQFAQNLKKDVIALYEELAWAMVFAFKRDKIDSAFKERDLIVISKYELEAQMAVLEKCEKREALDFHKKLHRQIVLKILTLDKEYRENAIILEKMKEAVKCCPHRIATIRTIDSIEMEIEAIKCEINKIEKIHGSEKDISDNYIVCLDSYKYVKEDINKQETKLEDPKKPQCQL